MGALRNKLAISLFAAATTLLAALPSAAESITAVVPEVSGEAMAVHANTGTNILYVTKAAANRVTVYNVSVGGPTVERIRHVPVGPDPRFIAMDKSAGGEVYVSNAGDGSLTIIQEDSLSTVTLPINASGPILLCGKVYVLRQVPNGGITAVDPATRTWSTIDTGPAPPTAFACNPQTGRLYVSFSGVGEVRVIDPASPSAPVARIPIPRPGPIAYNGLNNKVYVLADDLNSPIVAIDGNTHATQPVSLPVRTDRLARAVAVNARANRIVAGFSSGTFVVDGVSHNVTPVPTGDVRSIFADGHYGKTYVLDTGGVLTAIESETLRVEAVQIPGESFAVGHLFRLNSAYVVGSALTVVQSAGSEYTVDGINGQNLWWNVNGSESGWGINMTHQGNTLFATWFTYDAEGRGTWLVISDAKGGRNHYYGTVYRTTGPPFGAATFDASRVTRTAVGEAAIEIASTDIAYITATIDGVTLRKTLSRQVFAWPAPICNQGTDVGVIPNYQDLWWNSSESGWGLNIAHQGDILFVTWFTYDGNGKPMWLVGSNVAKTCNAAYAGTLYRTSGPPLAASPWDPARVSRMPAGNATLTFTDYDNGTFAYTVDGVSQTRKITRQVFAAPATACR